MLKIVFLVCALLLTPVIQLGATPGEDESPNMTNSHLAELVLRLDDEAIGENGSWRLQLEGFEVYVVTDENAGRMRAMVPVAPLEEVSEEVLLRMMQANFDSALDARYAIANDTLWAAFIHPLQDLSDALFFSGVAQAVNLAATYGTTFSSGALVFRGGDSAQQQRDYYQEIIDRANAI